jgi:uncharacterized membrane protein YtjA (UPF0391 family)
LPPLLIVGAFPVDQTLRHKSGDHGAGSAGRAALRRRKTLTPAMGKGSERHRNFPRRAAARQSPNGTNNTLPDLEFQRRDEGPQAMSLLKWALIMLVVSLVAALFGFTDLSAASADVARVLFYIFLVVFLVLLIMGLMGARAARGS